MLRSVFIAALLSVFLLCSCGSKEKSDELSASDVSVSTTVDGKSEGALPDIKFETEEHDFGRIVQGEKVSAAFKFKNTGKANLIISSAAGSCGCTVPEWPKEPVKPGQEGKITVVFSSEGKSGIQEKTITVVTNCEPSTRLLRIKTDIIVPESTVKD
jgi:hypothetical protein